MFRPHVAGAVLTGLKVRMEPEGGKREQKRVGPLDVRGTVKKKLLVCGEYSQNFIYGLAKADPHHPIMSLRAD